MGLSTKNRYCAGVMSPACTTASSRACTKPGDKARKPSVRI